MKFILNTTVILLLLPHKQKLIISSGPFFKKRNHLSRDNVILSNINLEVNHGEFLYIIGKTGSGKSSLMKTLYADLPLVEGEAHIVDFDLATLKNTLLRRK
jgi:cell division transport system ATP-binding protein